MEKTKDMVLTPEEAAERSGVALGILKAALHAGALPKTALPRRPGTRGPTARGVARRDLDAWIEQRYQQNAPPLPPHLVELRVSVRVASRLVGYSKQHVLQEIYEGKLRAHSLNLEDEPRHWQVRLADLAHWYARPERWYRRAAPRQFDPAILSQLEALVGAETVQGAGCGGQGEREKEPGPPALPPVPCTLHPPSNESGPAR